VESLEGVSATLAARRLGVILRTLRQRMKTLRVLDVAKAAGVSQPTWSQVETGVAVPTRDHLAGAIKKLEVDETTAEELLALRERAKQTEWWHRYDDVATSSYLKYIGYEASAVRTRCCTSGWIPGLLQTPDWARAGFLVPGAHARPENVDRAVELRMRRQSLLDEDDFYLHAICGEEALRYLAGGREVQLEQLRHLLAVVDKNDRVTLQVVPFSAGLHIGHAGPYNIVDFPHGRDTSIVYFEHDGPAVFVDTSKDVRLWSYVFDRLVETALTPERSVRLIRSVIKELS
jgi:transcriptional regulator with XRE-family HTH domain